MLAWRSWDGVGGEVEVYLWSVCGWSVKSVCEEAERGSAVGCGVGGGSEDGCRDVHVVIERSLVKCFGLKRTQHRGQMYGLGGRILIC